MGEVVQMKEADDADILTRFRKWWGRADKHTRSAIREIVNTEGEATKEMAADVLTFLNLKSGKSYRMVDANLDPIRMRLKSGVTVDDMKSVIALKCRQWANDEKMAPYLRPATLFNKTKFENYLGELE